MVWGPVRGRGNSSGGEDRKGREGWARARRVSRGKGCSRGGGAVSRVQGQM